MDFGYDDTPESFARYAKAHNEAARKFWQDPSNWFSVREQSRGHSKTYSMSTKATPVTRTLIDIATQFKKLNGSNPVIMLCSASSWRQLMYHYPGAKNISIDPQDGSASILVMPSGALQAGEFISVAKRTPMIPKGSFSVQRFADSVAVDAVVEA